MKLKSNKNNTLAYHQRHLQLFINPFPSVSHGAVFFCPEALPYPPSLSSGFILVGTSVHVGFFYVPGLYLAVVNHFIAL